MYYRYKYFKRAFFAIFIFFIACDFSLSSAAYALSRLDADLHDAVMNGNLQQVKTLIARGANVNSGGKSEITPLHRAAWNGHLEILKELIKAGADVNSKKDDGLTPLMSAAFNGKKEIIKELLDAGADIRIKSEGGVHIFDCLLSALEYGKFSIQEHDDLKSFLLKHAYGKGYVDFLASLYANPTDMLFGCLVHSGKVACVKKALNNGADVNYRLKVESGEHTPLMVALYDYSSNAVDIEIVRELITSGANVNIRLDGGLTPLLMAAAKGNIELVKILVDSGADIRISDDGGTNIFKMINFAAEKKQITKAQQDDIFHFLFVRAIEKGYVDFLLSVDLKKDDLLSACSRRGLYPCVRNAIKAGANVNAEDKEYLTPLMYAIFNGNVDIIKDLLDGGADVLASTKHYNSIFEFVNFAKDQGKITDSKAIEIVGLLLKKFYEKGEINSLLKAGVMPRDILINCASAYVQCVRHAIKSGASANSRGADGRAPLDVAADAGQAEIVELLLEVGAEINALDNNGMTPLMYAARKGNTAVTKLLLAKRANPHAKDKNGWSALVWAAATNKHDEVVKLLEPYAKFELDFAYLAIHYQDKGDRMRADNYIDKAIKLNPSHENVRLIQGIIFAGRKDYANAIDANRRAIEINPRSKVAWENLSLYNRQMKDYKNALVSINKAEDLDPENYDYKNTAAELYLMQGDIVNSCKTYEKAIKLVLKDIQKEKTVDKYAAAAWFTLFTPRYREAEGYAKEGLALDTRGFALHVNLAHAYLFQEKKAEAITEYKKAIEMDIHRAGEIKDDFALLEKRYPDKTSLIEWAEKELGIK